ncbi:MAG TPA: serine acetyltransferase [Candidatus Anaerostipes avistercoris]|uniref:Serine acetyltransferase n=1 Tax=Candidatus Anaerostipes avistercoris TaxID=2838462 RepID=A0A9D2PHZ2_9FIRM|nr:serine acetyltransferase [Candidatus Anaerostipes avistercoris]
MTGKQYKLGLKSLLQRHLFHNLQFTYYFRKYEESAGFLSRLMIYKLSRKYGLEISPKAQIGEGMYLGHPYNITVGDGVIIGKNVNLHKGCTIGRTNRGNIGSPVIGNCVFIGINATIVGNIHIGNDVLIAPNSYVNIDVPDHSVVIGNPAIIHHHNHATKDYIVFTV